MGAVSKARAFRVFWRSIAGPLAVFLIHMVVLWTWHNPVLFQAALTNEWIHGVQHASFLLTACLFWWVLIHGRYGRMGYGVAVLFVFVTGVHSGLLGALLTLGSRLWYPAYEARSAAWNVNALDDQQLAGVIMWVPSGVIMMLVALALFAAWLGEAERRVRYTESSASKAR